MPGGRPSLFTPELAARIVELTRAGNVQRVVCESVGISQRALSNWLRRGRREQEGPHRSFVLTYNEAVSAAQSDLVQIVRDAAARDPKYACWLLERRWPEQWGTYAREVRDLRQRVQAVVEELAALKTEAQQQQR